MKNVRRRTHIGKNPGVLNLQIEDTGEVADGSDACYMEQQLLGQYYCIVNEIGH